MNKNKQLLYCILGSFLLTLLNGRIFEMAIMGLFPSGYGGVFLGEVVVLLSNVLSLLGVILLAIFSIILIVKNMKLKS